jgi:hypothetical protein
MMQPCLSTAALLALLVAMPAMGDEGLLASWDFDEGGGATVKDAVGSANGTISGATFVPCGKGYALRLDGVDDSVDFGSPPSLAPADQVTLEVWVNPERVPTAGEPGIVGKGYGNYVLTYYVDGRVWWYAGTSTVSCRAPVPTGGWHHVVGTSDHGATSLYVDGVLASSNEGRTGPIASGLSFSIGKSQGAVQWTKNAHFAGMIDDVRLYGRALTAEEVLVHYRNTHLTGTVDLTAYPYYANREVAVSLDLRGLGEIQPGATAKVELVRAGTSRPVATQQLGSLESWGKLEASLKSSQLQPGEYEVRAEALGADGKPLGKAGMVRLTWPAAPAWPVRDPHLRVLNSLVTELRNESNLAAARTVVQFSNPREGWVFFRTTADSKDGGSVRLEVPSAGKLATVIRQDCRTAPVMEAMRRLPQGVHQAVLTCLGGARVTSLVIRSIPEIGYCRVDCGPQLAPYGPCDWPYLEKHVLPNINLAVSRGDDGERDHWRAWRRQGKRWIVETPLPGLGTTEGVSPDEVEKQWIENGKADEPLLDGMIVDEFGAGDEPIWQAWHEGLTRVKARSGFAGKVFYPYCGPLFGAKGSQDFAQTVMDAGWACALERYLPEQRTESAARAAIQANVINTLQAWEQAQPGAIAHTLVVWGFFIGAPPESCNVDPGVDYKAFTDMQMHALANDPTTFGLYGVASYLSAYSDEETIRWTSRLYRHYCIEGRTERLTNYYRLPHLANPDFEEGLKGWSAKSAEPGTIATGAMSGLSWLEGRYPPTTQGDTYALLRRSDRGPNQLSQMLKALEPGKLYSLKLISADYDDLQAGRSIRKTHALRVDLGDVETIADRTFQFPYPSCYDHVQGSFNRQNQAFLNLFNIVFRAKGRETQLTISDWLGADRPGGPTGQQLLLNFVEVQPYYDGD